MELGFKADTMKLDEFIKSIGSLNMSSILAGTTLGGLYEMANRALNGTKELAQDMRFFATETGMSAQKMQSWSQTARQLGIDGKQVEDTLRNLQTKITQTKLGNPDQGLLQAYSLLNNYGKAGIKITDDYFLQIEKMRSGFLKINPDMRRTVASMAGMNDQMLNFLLMSDKDWSKRNVQPVINNDQIQQMKEMNQEWVKLSQDLTIIGNTFSTQISPVIIGTTRTLIELLKEIGESFIGKTLALSAEGWGRIGEYTQGGLDNMTMGAASIANAYEKAFAPEPTAQAIPNVNATFHIQGGDVQAMKKAAKDAMTESIAEAYYALHPRGN